MIKISQTAVKEFYSQETKCSLRWWMENIEGIDRPSSPVMVKGQIFEYHLIGATRDGNVPTLGMVGQKSAKPSRSATKQEKLAYLSSKGIPAFFSDTSETLSQLIQDAPEDLLPGTLSQDEILIRDLAIRSREILPLLGIEIESTQQTLEYGSFKGHPDIVGKVKRRRAIVDIKFTETAEDDRWNGWGDPGSKPWTDLLQSVFYPFLHYRKTGEIADFYYLIFGKSGWIKWVRMEYDPEVEFARLEARLEQMIKEVENLKPSPSKDYNVCLKCHLREGGQCTQFAKVPALENVTI
jgi:hypothetical protein